MRGSGSGRIFLSYRRQDAAWPARELYDILVAEFGADRIFKDVDDIEPGDDFVDRIQSAVGACDVLLALIGPMWLSVTDDSGRRRLDDPEDFVRLEVETALSRPDVRVIPILIDRAPMPRPSELPPGLRALTRRQAVEINPVTLDTRRLLAVVHDTLNRDAPELDDVPVDGPVTVANPRTTPVRRRRTTVVVGAAVAAVLALLAVPAINLLREANDVGSGSPGASATGPATTAPSPEPSPSPTPSSTPSSPTGSDIVAHRGGNEKYPLETLQALTQAADDGFAVETDVRWTKDGRAIVVHDEAATLGVQCDEPYKVSQTTWDELRNNCRSQSKGGKTYPISTYASVMDGLGGYDAWVYVEVKVDQDAEQDRELLAGITDNGLSDRTVVTSTELDRLAAIRTLAPDLRYMLFTSEPVPPDEISDQHLWGVAVKGPLASKKYVASLQEAGLVVVVWTLNEEDGWAEARSAGADKVLTDRPQEYATWLAGQ